MIATYSDNDSARKMAVKTLGEHNQRHQLEYIRDETEFTDTRRAARRLVGTM